MLLKSQKFLVPKFEINYKKLANLFYFIQNLSNWHFSCREKNNKEWLLMTGNLNKKEKGILKCLAPIFKKYSVYNLEKKIYLLFFIYILKKERGN